MSNFIREGVWSIWNQIGGAVYSEINSTRGCWKIDIKWNSTRNI